MTGMGFLDFAAAVALGNILTLMFFWGCTQFHRHDYKAPWMAYAGFLVPIAFIAVSVLAIEGPPPHLDAIGTLQPAAQSQ